MEVTVPSLLPPVRKITALDGNVNTRKKIVKMASAWVSNRLQKHSVCRKQVALIQRKKTSIIVAFWSRLV